MTDRPPPPGRGATGNPGNRYAAHAREACDDGWGSLDAEPPPLRTELLVDRSRTVISYNQSPDVPFDRSINPYRGCEHGCVYCFARPTHAWLGLSPGLDFESRLFHKPDAPAVLRGELAKPGYRCAAIALGINTDAYQPVERRLGLTRAIIEVLAEHGHPFTVVTKSALIERDLDLLGPLAARGLVQVAISVTTLDRHLARTLEPRAAAPERRLETLRRLAAAGVPVTALVAPVIPFLNDHELEAILAAAHAAGARDAGYALVRLPLEVKELFRDWLALHAPLKAERVLNRLRDCRAGKDNDSRFGSRMRGEGEYADLIARRFALARRRLAFPGVAALDCSQFRVPGRAEQLDLFT
ncbi:PA0069 family radical SAM protein [Parasulfuritortus cantonensis]|uniref:PA0069 family radical SAM protein n=1 Tax=Parasulfuritortus cantonensis TaxID=2528202 RepID=A0A4R1BFA4_9PROT|nr:PA0069 family radical SAM protein [Parasulfuritortus cantonensis]TCJ15787.1 PA0069 family radical SAM protein [Parasulfuritortus cantonensis]